MDDSPKKLTFGALQLPAIDARLKPGQRPVELGPLDEKVLVSFRLTRGLILRLKEANHWVPGFREQDFLEACVREGLEKLGDQVQPLPPLLLTELLRRSKKLQR